MSQHRRGTNIRHGQDHPDLAPGAFPLNGRQEAFQVAGWGRVGKPLAAVSRGARQGSFVLVSDYDMHSFHSQRPRCRERASGVSIQYQDPV